MDNGLSFVVNAGWSLPPGYPNFSTTWIEMIGTEGALLVDDSHRDVVLNTMREGMRLPMSSMPGEFVDHAYAGPMKAETVHFLEAVACDRPVLVTAEQARAGDGGLYRGRPFRRAPPAGQPAAAGIAHFRRRPLTYPRPGKTTDEQRLTQINQTPGSHCWRVSSVFICG